MNEKWPCYNFKPQRIMRDYYIYHKYAILCNAYFLDLHKSLKYTGNESIGATKSSWRNKASNKDTANSW